MKEMPEVEKKVDELAEGMGVKKKIEPEMTLDDLKTTTPDTPKKKVRRVAVMKKRPKREWYESPGMKLLGLLYALATLSGLLMAIFDPVSGAAVIILSGVLGALILILFYYDGQVNEQYMEKVAAKFNMPTYHVYLTNKDGRINVDFVSKKSDFVEMSIDRELFVQYIIQNPEFWDFVDSEIQKPKPEPAVEE